MQFFLKIDITMSYYENNKQKTFKLIEYEFRAI